MAKNTPSIGRNFFLPSFSKINIIIGIAIDKNIIEVFVRYKPKNIKETNKYLFLLLVKINKNNKGSKLATIVFQKKYLEVRVSYVE